MSSGEVQVKSCYLNTEIFLLKFAIFGCLPGEHNIFKQVGLSGIYLIGNSISSYGFDIDIRDEINYSDFILNKLQQLSTFKALAVATEDFLKAGAY